MSKFLNTYCTDLHYYDSLLTEQRNRDRVTHRHRIGTFINNCIQSFVSSLQENKYNHYLYFRVRKIEKNYKEFYSSYNHKRLCQKYMRLGHDTCICSLFQPLFAGFTQYMPTTQQTDSQVCPDSHYQYLCLRGDYTSPPVISSFCHRKS